MRVHALQTGAAQVRRAQVVGRGPGPWRMLAPLLDPRWTELVPMRAWLIEHPEGPILVDTGETARVNAPGYLPRWHPYYRRVLRQRVEPHEEIGPRLRAIGVAPEDVRRVVLTHMHLDHTGGLDHLPRSEFLVTATELACARGWRGRANGYLPHRWPDWFAPRELTLPERPYGPFPRSLALTAAEDVILVDTAGHTPGHVSVVVENDGGPRLFLAGDAAYTQELMLARRIDGVSPDAAQARQTLERMHRLIAERPTVFLPTHDPDAERRLAALEPVR
jgi:glyoxylase-like metal-dependent hydrolase (beta-lactamase superfamily II)